MNINIAVYYGSKSEYHYLKKMIEAFCGGDFCSVKMYSCFYDVLYDIENKKQYDIIIFGTEHHEQTLITGRKIKQIIRDVVLIYIGNDSSLAPKAVEIGAYRYITVNHKDELTNGLFSAAKEVIKKRGRQYAIVTNRRYQKIPCVDIKYCYKSGKMSVIVTEYGEFKERVSLYELYKRLKSLSDKFIMIERGHIISISKIIHIEKNMVALEGDIRLPIGRTYMAILKDIRNEFRCFANNC